MAIYCSLSILSTPVRVAGFLSTPSELSKFLKDCFKPTKDNLQELFSYKSPTTNKSLLELSYSNSESFKTLLKLKAMQGVETFEKEILSQNTGNQLSLLERIIKEEDINKFSLRIEALIENSQNSKPIIIAALNKVLELKSEEGFQDKLTKLFSVLKDHASSTTYDILMDQNSADSTNILDNLLIKHATPFVSNINGKADSLIKLFYDRLYILKTKGTLAKDLSIYTSDLDKLYKNLANSISIAVFNQQNSDGLNEYELILRQNDIKKLEFLQSVTSNYPKSYFVESKTLIIDYLLESPTLQSSFSKQLQLSLVQDNIAELKPFITSQGQDFISKLFTSNIFKKAVLENINLAIEQNNAPGLEKLLSLADYYNVELFCEILTLDTLKIAYSQKTADVLKTLLSYAYAKDTSLPTFDSNLCKFLETIKFDNQPTFSTLWDYLSQKNLVKNALECVDPFNMNLFDKAVKAENAPLLSFLIKEAQKLGVLTDMLHPQNAKDPFVIANLIKNKTITSLLNEAENSIATPQQEIHTTCQNDSCLNMTPAGDSTIHVDY